MIEKLFNFLHNLIVSEKTASNDEEKKSFDQNFSLNILNGSLTKLGDQLVSPGLVLTWLFGVLGISESFIGALVPIRKSFALLPQLFISGLMRKYKRRKWFWAVGAFGFSLGFFLMIPAVLLLEESAAVGWVLLGLLGFASLSRGVSSVAFTDVVGKTIISGERGRLLAARATSGGVLALIAGVFLRWYAGSNSDTQPLVFLIGAGALLWLVGGLLVLFMVEPKSDQNDARDIVAEIRAGYRLLRKNINLRRFVGVRSLLLPVQLSTPFYILYSREYISADFGNLAVFFILISTANVISSPLWGRFSDRSSKTVIITGGSIAVLAGVLAIGVKFLPSNWQNVYVLGSLLLLLGFSQAGIRLGRKTYFLDIAPEAERPLYSAIINLIIGILTLLSSALGVLVDIFSIGVVIAIVSAVPVIGIILSFSLPEATETG